MKRVKVIYADPAWSFDDKGSRIAPDNEECGQGYETMSTDDICDLPVGRYGLPDSALFLWGTWTHVLNGDCTRVARAWGYEPKVVVPWAKLSRTPGATTAKFKDHPVIEWLYQQGYKIQIGAGHYVRACVEPLIICARGSATVPAADRIPGLIAMPRPGGHSTKPPVYDLIEGMYPDGPYLELFARDVEQRPGWHYVGNQVRVREARAS